MLIEGQPPAADGAPATAREGDDLAWLAEAIDCEVPEDLRTIADKVSWLRARMHPAGRPPYAWEDIEERIKAGVTATGRAVDPAVRPTYRASGRQIANVAGGATANPKFEMLSTIAAFFHIDPKFFFAPSISAGELFAPARQLVGARPPGNTARRSATARMIATRADNLSLRDQLVVLGLVERLAARRTGPRKDP